MGGPKVHKVSGGRAQGSQAACDVLRIAIDLKLGYCGTVRRRDAETQVQVQGTGLTLYQGRTTPGCKNRKDNMKIEKNNFVVTFKTEKEVSDYIGMHIPEERRLLWLGFFIANNYIAQKLEDDGIELVKKK